MAAKNPKIVVVGSINVDRFVSIKRLPGIGETLTGSDGFSCIGGKGANSAASASRLGGDVTFICCVGSDGNRKWLTGEMSKLGVNMAYINQSQKVTGQAYIFRLPKGENAIILDPAANRDWPDLTEKQIELIKNADMVMLQREIPEKMNIRVAEVANEAGVPVCLDAGGEDTSISKDLLQLLTIFSPNETEASWIIDTKGKSNSEICTELQKFGIKNVLLKLGSEGAFWQDEKGNTATHPAFKVEVKDTTGAGDTFTGAFCVKHAENRTIEEALKFACCAGGLCVTKVGTLPAIPSKADVDLYLEQLLAEKIWTKYAKESKADPTFKGS